MILERLGGDAADSTDSTDPVLECLGLTRLAESMYQLLLQRPEWDTPELAVELGSTEEAVEASRAELAGLGLIWPSHENPGRMVAIQPNLGLGALIAEREAALLKEQHELQQARTAMMNLMREREAAQGARETGEIEYLRSLDSTRNRIAELSKDVQSEILALIPKAGLSPESLEASQKLDGEVLARGVSLRTLYLDSVRNHPATQQYAVWLTGLGGEIRTVPTLPMRIIVIDRKTAILPIDPKDSRAGAVLMREESVIAAVIALFERLWESALPLGTSGQRDDQGLTAQERELLRILASGLTDEAAGKRLGLSLRSVRRVMADLMTRLEARSRFEAGVRAVECGWL
ncbi:helix-turn-helix transcriptional regulator [Streptomyces sp. PCS3-D2]|uniref:helix-turn-helix domain-containing protein n=1 Tax=Streptomyces sp. PCS3-D2 TaxID=1460244 RepID=UPI000446D988|nr:helix-turn-helix transcriptional regulator [Streptomyces sp. PCS3-D2]WKV72877.1 helix-turn-helix transcriptional regulator [Streptomyces sp. PCS3-D2]